MDSLLLVFLLLVLGFAHWSMAAPVLQSAPPLMSSQLWSGAADPIGFLVSEKLDGVRAYWDGEHLYTRSGRRITAPDWFVADFPAQALDGELWAGRGRFEFVSGVVRSHKPVDSEWRQLSYQVFDLPGSPAVFEQRYRQLLALLNPLASDWVRPLQQVSLSSDAELSEHLQAVVAAGGEGLMLHRKSALYEPVRSPHLLKYKPFQDAEAIVVGYSPGKGKYQGMVGALRVRTPDGREFGIGSGLTDALRTQPPAIGSQVTYRYNGYTNGGLPRFARFLRVRQED